MKDVEAKGGGGFGIGYAENRGARTMSIRAEKDGYFVEITFVGENIANALSGGQSVPCRLTLLGPDE